ncbi:MAG: metallophosphoesterase [Candidatus Eisenbacteria bacterium]
MLFLLLLFGATNGQAMAADDIGRAGNEALGLRAGVLIPTRGPYLQSPTSTSLVVRWRTGTASLGRASYGTEPGTWIASVDEPTSTTEHEVTLTGLAPDTRYYYEVSDIGGFATGSDSAATFLTPPTSSSRQATRIWVWGDGGLDNVNSRAVRDAFIARTRTQPADVGLMLGDNAYYSGTDSEYQSGCFTLLQPILKRLPFLSTRGNHEVLVAGANNDYYDFFTLPSAGQAGGIPSGSEAYYSFNWANVHFICLDSEGSDRTLAGPMIQWLRMDLAASQSDWNVCFWHHPPYTKGSHDSDNITDSGGRMRDMRENVLPILDSTGVDLVLAGHSHSYERSYLIRGHYGLSTTFTEAMKVQPGDGRPQGGGAYTKATNGKGPFEGSVYAVAGSSSQLTTLASHPAMVSKVAAFGSMLIDVVGNQFEARFLDLAGVVRDSFVIIKPQVLDTPPHSRPATLVFAAPQPNPSRQSSMLRYVLPSRGRVDLMVLDVSGRVVTRVVGGFQEAGEHRAEWRGVDDRGRSVAAGIYYARLEWNAQKRLQRLVRLR